MNEFELLCHPELFWLQKKNKTYKYDFTAFLVFHIRARWNLSEKWKKIYKKLFCSRE